MAIIEPSGLFTDLPKNNCARHVGTSEIWFRFVHDFRLWLPAFISLQGHNLMTNGWPNKKGLIQLLSKLASPEPSLGVALILDCLHSHP